MDGFDKRKQQKIKQIFSASFELVTKYGFDKVKVDEIARKARVSPATIYNYFGTKEQLFQETVDHWIDSRIAEYEMILDSELSFSQKIKDLMMHEAKNIKILITLNQENPITTHYFLHEAEEKMESFYSKLIDQGKKEGYISSAYSEEILITHFKLFFHETNHYIHENSSEQIEQLLHLLFYGLFPHSTQ
ncbi:TetR/AcrR family transcriptional regulator [Enterococcus ureasiticus]|uniref:HTH tetR-type domain-containing protein n=1 Tax=Enterococcus ureasiticus TaxID=903984 RepID=A0A1E5GIV2_9ENTE|nr:TetR/AcrR family transcriptional regulator [Enterococcus ureasiticus]OEG12180.1 hypothetical protein BCR21_08055 [Enterococcus ureasiticus]